MGKAASKFKKQSSVAAHLLMSKIRVKQIEKRKQIEVEKKLEYKEIFKSGFQYRPLVEVKTMYELETSRNGKLDFLMTYILPYRRAYVYNFTYQDNDEKITFYKEVFDFLNSEHKKINSKPDDKSDFELYLSLSGLAILEKLKLEYSRKLSKELAIMIAAMLTFSEDPLFDPALGLITENKPDFYRMLKETFNSEFSLTALKKQMDIYLDDPGTSQKGEIKLQAKKIAEFLKS